MAKLKPWYHAVTPREDLRENRSLDASEFAVNLEHIRTNRENLSVDYKNPARFFDRTYLTKSLLDLSAQALRRLSGITLETSAVFNMATQFGGGKTHSLATLFHLARGGETARAWKGVDAVLAKAGVSTVPSASVAVFVGLEFDVLAGRGEDGEPIRKTPWGEIAWQLGGAEAYRVVAEHDARGVAPGGDVIRKFLPDGPTLILMDELLNYMSRWRKLGAGAGLFDFLQNLTEEARARDNVVLCVSVPASELEMNPEDQRDYDSIKKLLDRVGKAIMMSAETETAEIIRRRLFEWGGLPDDGRKAALEYADWAIENSPSLTGLDASNAREMFLAAYPFHPAVLSVFERKWQSLPRFQRTRGILRLLALWVQRAYQEEHRRGGGKGDAVITLGSAPIEDPTFRSAMFEQLGSTELEISVTTDIAGKSDAWAMRLDRDAADAIKKDRLHQKVATTILFESNGGQTNRLTASLPEIRAAVGAPDVNLTDIEHVLEQLTSSCYYLSQDGNQYKFGLTPNLNKILTDRRAAIAKPMIEQRVKKELENHFKLGPPISEVERVHSPSKPGDVPERAILTFVLMGIDQPAESPATVAFMEKIVREVGTKDRTMKSALFFVAPENPGAISAAARDLLAWEEIEDDDDTKRRLDESQRRHLILGLGRARSELKESIWRAYRHLFFLGKDNTLRTMDLGQLNSSSAGNTGGAIQHFLDRLTRDDEIVDALGSTRLLKGWPAGVKSWSTKSVREACYSSPYYPRLRRAESIKRTIADGVTQHLFGYARDDGRGWLILERFQAAMAEHEVEISDDFYLLKAEEAQRLKEPPRIVELRVLPGSVALAVMQKASLTAEGVDQYGQTMAIERVEWEASGGTIDGAGLFSAGSEPGAFWIRARAHGVTATVAVQLSGVGDPGPSGDLRARGPQSTTGVMTWSGVVPPQKWMNFYTKVVSRHVANPGLKMTVRIDVPLQADELAARKQELNANLRELGLDAD
ncbi:MAG: ATP-binding protein [Phycisphaerae bacterium]